LLGRNNSTKRKGDAKKCGVQCNDGTQTKIEWAKLYESKKAKYKTKK